MTEAVKSNYTGVSASPSLSLISGSHVSSNLDQSAAGRERYVDASVVLLTHYLPLYQVRVLQELAKRVKSLKILLSTPIEPNRNFTPDWGGLDVEVQKSLMFRRRWAHQSGFNDEHYLHVPYDTLSLLRRLRPQVVMSHELGPRSMVASLYRVLNRRSRLILMTYMSEHTEMGRGRLRMALRRRLLHRADAVTFNGPSCQRYLLTQGLHPGKLFSLPYAADDRVFCGCGTDRDEAEVREKLVCVGQLNERKGVVPMLKQLVDYCLSRPQRQLKLTFVGQGPLREALLSIARPSNLSVDVISHLSPDDLARLYKTQGAALHPTLADEWLMVVNESMHCGLPVIGSCYAQAVETLVRDGKNGWNFDPLKVGDLAEKLDAYFSMSDQETSEMRNQAIATVEERSPCWAVRGAVDAIETVIENRGQR